MNLDLLKKAEKSFASKNVIALLSEKEILPVAVVDILTVDDSDSNMNAILSSGSQTFEWVFRMNLTNKDGKKQQYSVKGYKLALESARHLASFKQPKTFYMLFIKDSARKKIYHFFATKEEAEKFVANRSSSSQINYLEEISKAPKESLVKNTEYQSLKINLQEMKGYDFHNYIKNNKDRIAKYPDLVDLIKIREKKSVSA
jgi:hypothetical protein